MKHLMNEIPHKYRSRLNIGFLPILVLFALAFFMSIASPAAASLSENRTGHFLSSEADFAGVDGGSSAGLHRAYSTFSYDFTPNSLDASKTGSKFWSKAEFNGQKVYQRNDLINPKLVDARGRTNLERMQKGLAPVGPDGPDGPDGKSINLHHSLQSNDSALVEISQTFHQQNTKTIHINPSSTPSGIDRKAFNAFKRDYWKSRGNDF